MFGRAELWIFLNQYCRRGDFISSEVSVRKQTPAYLLLAWGIGSFGPSFGPGDAGTQSLPVTQIKEKGKEYVNALGLIINKQVLRVSWFENGFVFLRSRGPWIYFVFVLFGGRLGLRLDIYLLKRDGFKDQHKNKIDY